MKYILFILITAFTCCCSQKIDSKMMENPSNYLIFHDSIIFHFPDESNKEMPLKKVTFISNSFDIKNKTLNSPFKPKYHFEEYNTNDQQIFDSIYNYFDSIAIEKIRPTDTDYFIVGLEPSMIERFGEDSLKVLYENSIRVPIIVDFHLGKRKIKNIVDSNYCGLSEEFEIFILNHRNISILPKNEQIDWDLLPEEIKHGYSLGVSMKREPCSIIYWVVAW